MHRGFRSAGEGSGVRKVAFIGTGGTIASIGKGPLDYVNYGANGVMLQAGGILDRFPEVQQVAEVFAVPYRNVPSPQIGWKEWQELVLLCDRVVAETPDLAGIVIGHGTASLEETAYFLSLALKVPVPVVVVGSQRPASSLSTDAGLNLVNAVRVAAERGGARPRRPGAAERRDPGGAGGDQDLDRPDADLPLARISACLAMPMATGWPGTAGRCASWRRIPNSTSAGWPRCRGSMSPTATPDADGTAVRAFTAAGREGHRRGRLRPGLRHPGRCRRTGGGTGRQGVVVVQSTRAGSGRVFPTTKLAEAGFIPADNLNPQKARILLALA